MGLSTIDWRVRRGDRDSCANLRYGQRRLGATGAKGAYGKVWYGTVSCRHCQRAGRGGA